MIMNIRVVALRLAAMLICLGDIPLSAAAPARADTITFKIRSFAANQIDVRFHSTSRKVVWPARGKVWTLKDYKVHDLKLTCVTGEQICYGAVLRGNPKRYWGVGGDGKQRCAACCATCNGNNLTKVFDLNQ
jgi:hypothetical protein